MMNSIPAATGARDIDAKADSTQPARTKRLLAARMLSLVPTEEPGKRPIRWLFPRCISTKRDRG